MYPKSILFTLFLFICAATMSSIVYAQSIVDDIDSASELPAPEEMFTETIQVIGRSKRIFIISNSNQMLTKGDFITLVVNETQPVARALVGKESQGKAGIKIVKIYSLKRWTTLKRGKDVRIAKGDDSYLFVKKKEKKEQDQTDEQIQIKTEEDLYNTTMIDEDVNMFGKDNRHIKPDNILSVSYSRYTLVNDITDQNEVYNQYSGSWAYQFTDNIWLEGLYGRVLMSGVPAEGTQTLINDFTARLKYIFSAPLYSYFLPYIGYKMHFVSSPDAGNVENDALAEKELMLIDKMKKNDLVFGVTILRRLVPGWFIKADLGTDQMNIGFAIEF